MTIGEMAAAYGENNRENKSIINGAAAKKLSGSMAAARSKGNIETVADSGCLYLNEGGNVIEAATSTVMVSHKRTSAMKHQAAYQRMYRHQSKHHHYRVAKNDGNLLA